MYGIYANIWGILMVNVTIIYGIHGSYGIDLFDYTFFYFVYVMTDCEILSFCTGSLHLRPLRYFLNCKKCNTIMCAQTSQFCVCADEFSTSLS